jgi:hypothetical protein
MSPDLAKLQGIVQQQMWLLHGLDRHLEANTLEWVLLRVDEVADHD